MFMLDGFSGISIYPFIYYLLLTGDPLLGSFFFSGMTSAAGSSTRPLMRSTTVELLTALEVTVTVLLMMPAWFVL